MIEVTCAHCARIFRRTRGAVKRTKLAFCNDLCRSKYFVGERAANWRGGHDPNRGPGWLKLARSIRDRDGHICTRCGMTEAENRQKLDVDHIQPWRSLIEFGIEVANAPENLTSLCRKCHRWKTATIEQRWLDRGDCLAMSEYQKQVKLPPLFARSV
jgi:5-methylcytosine-specific restriction endonuclease McrA